MAFSDYRVQDIDELADWIANWPNMPDLIIYGGDDIARFRESGNNRFEKLAKLSKHGICAIIGNDDIGSARKYIAGKKVYNIHKEPLLIDDHAIIGIEGAIFDPKEPDGNGIGFTLYPEDTARKHLEAMVKRVGRSKKLIIVSHTPPRDVLDFAIRFGQRNIGSKALRHFIEKNSSKVPLVICGHAHFQGGKDERVSKTTVVNAASHDYEGADGRIALIEITPNGRATVQWRTLGTRFGLWGVGHVKGAKFHAAGIHRIEQILELTPEALTAILGCRTNTAHSLHLRAKSVIENKAIVLKPLIALDDNAIFLDIETDLAQKLVWLIGVYFVKEDRFVRYFAERPRDEKAMLQRFLKEMEGVNGTIYTYSSTRFDERVLKNRIVKNGLDYSKLPAFLDICPEIRRSVIFPIQSYALKDIAKYFGYKYRHPDLDGMTVAMSYMVNYQKTRDKKLLRKLFEYNEDDVRSLPAIAARVGYVVSETAIDIVR